MLVNTLRGFPFLKILFYYLVCLMFIDINYSNVIQLIFPQLDCFKYSYLTLIILFNDHDLFAHSFAYCFQTAANRNHWQQFGSCLKSSSDRGATGFSQKREVFSMNEIHAEPPFLCDYVRNGYCKRVITSTVKSKRVLFFFNHKLNTGF